MRKGDGDKQLESEATLGVKGRDCYQIGESVVDMTRPRHEVQPVTVRAQPQDIRIDLRKTAILVIDMQNDFCTRGGWFDSLGVDVSGVQRMYAPIRGVTGALRDREVPVIWVNWGVRADRANLSPGTRYAFHRVGCGVGLGDPSGHQGGDSSSPGVLEETAWGAAIVDDLAPDVGDIFVSKHRISGFWDTPLDAILRRLQVNTLLFAGVNSDHCVYSTLIDANFHGYDTVLLEDCTMTSSPAFCHEATLHNVRFCFGFTITSSDLSSALS